MSTHAGCFLRFELGWSMGTLEQGMEFYLYILIEEGYMEDCSGPFPMEI